MNENQPGTGGSNTSRVTWSAQGPWTHPFYYDFLYTLNTTTLVGKVLLKCVSVKFRKLLCLLLM